MAENGGNSAKQEQVILALASGSTTKNAAAATNTGTRTIDRWLQDANFRKRIAIVRGELFGQSVGVLIAIASRAAAKLGLLLDARDDKIKLGAARAVLELATKLRESVELETRLTNLEQMMIRKNNVKGQ